MQKLTYPKKAIDLTDRTFARTIKRFPMVVVCCLSTTEYTFGSPIPIIDMMAMDYKEKVLFGILNVKQNKKIATHYDIEKPPVFLIFKNGRLVGYLKNDVTRKNIENRIEQYI